VVSTPLKNISQIGSSSQLLGRIKHVPNHQPEEFAESHHVSWLYKSRNKKALALSPNSSKMSAYAAPGTGPLM